jgi:type IV secretion system protein TrbF
MNKTKNTNSTDLSTVSPAVSTPYSDARKDWDERNGSQITRARNWRAAAFVSLGCLLVTLIGLVGLALRSKVVPYVVVMDHAGAVISQGTAEQASPVDDRLKRAALYDWIQNFRMVSSDQNLEQNAIRKVYGMVGNGSPAATKVSEFYTGSSPLIRAQTEIVSIEVHAVYASSPDSYEIDWTEKTMNSSGAVTGTQTFKGSFRIAIHPPQDEAIARTNPLGLYVTDINVSKEL